MLKTLKQYFPENDGALTILLLTGYRLRDTTDLAYKLLETLVDSWLHTDVTMNSLYSALELKGYYQIDFENPRFLLWLKFFKSRYQEAYKRGNGANVRLDKAGNKADKKLKPGDQATEHTSLTEAEKVIEAEKAEKAFVEDTVRFLYEHHYSTSYLKSVCTAGLKVGDTEVKEIATKLLQRLNEADY